MEDGLRDEPGAEVPLELLDAFTAKRLSRADRLAAGKALRASCPRSSLAGHHLGQARPDPVELIIRQNATRIPALVPVRMGRMLASPFSFLRGSAAVMAADLATTPITGLKVMACGDMHLSNFGLFASAERNLIFAINDFDEVHPGPWEWDLKRLASSAAVAARFLGGGLSHAEEAAHSVVRSYVKQMRRYSEMGVLEVWYDRIDEARILAIVPDEFRKITTRILAKAHARGHIQTLERLTEEVDGEHRLIEERPIIVRDTHLTDGTPVPVALDRMLKSYLASLTDERRHLLRRYQIVDVVRKVVGVGSVGTSCWVILLKGAGNDDPLFLQVKEANPSVLAPYASTGSPARNEGHRVVIGQRLIQGSPDIFLGWGPDDPAQTGHYYVRQLADMKGSVQFVEGNRAGISHLYAYARLCGWALALAHAKSGDAAMISGYCGRSDALPEAISAYALAYHDQTMRDFDLLSRAAKNGRVPVLTGV
jgi:uncharacterized protein (DUF2252 family)